MGKKVKENAIEQKMKQVNLDYTCVWRCGEECQVTEGYISRRGKTISDVYVLRYLIQYFICVTVETVVLTDIAWLPMDPLNISCSVM
jgi:hypothetical protein